MQYCYLRLLLLDYRYHNFLGSKLEQTQTMNDITGHEVEALSLGNFASYCLIVSTNKVFYFYIEWKNLVTYFKENIPTSNM